MQWVIWSELTTNLLLIYLVKIFSEPEIVKALQVICLKKGTIAYNGKFEILLFSDNISEITMIQKFFWPK